MSATTLPEYDWGTSPAVIAGVPSPFYARHNAIYPSSHSSSIHLLSSGSNTSPSDTDIPPTLSLRDAYSLPPPSSIQNSPRVAPVAFSFSRPLPNNFLHTSEPDPLLSHVPSPLSQSISTLMNSSSVIIFAPHPVPSDQLRDYLCQFGRLVDGPSPLLDQPQQLSVTLDSHTAAQAAIKAGNFFLGSIPIGIIAPRNPNESVLDRQPSSLGLASMSLSSSTIQLPCPRPGSPSRLEEIEKVSSSSNLFRPSSQSSKKKATSQYHPAQLSFKPPQTLPDSQPNWIESIAKWLLDIF